MLATFRGGVMGGEVSIFTGRSNIQLLRCIAERTSFALRTLCIGNPVLHWQIPCTNGPWCRNSENTLSGCYHHATVWSLVPWQWCQCYSQIITSISDRSPRRRGVLFVSSVSDLCCTEALEYHSSSFLFPQVSFVSRELVLFPAS